MPSRQSPRDKLCNKLQNLLNVAARVRTDRAFKELGESEYTTLQERSSALADHVDHVLRLAGCTGIGGAIGERVKHLAGRTEQAED